jgi:alanine racemase
MPAAGAIMALRELKNPIPAEEPAGPVADAAAGPPQSETGGVLTIDIGAIQSNYRTLRAKASPAECAAVVKADAYGCGLEPVVRALDRSGCKTYFVAHLAEGRAVRALAPEATIYALNGLAPGAAPAFADAHVRPVIGSLQELAEWDAFCSASGWRGGAALHFDTGMNRLGIPADEAAALAGRIKMPDHGITLVMSHFACADTPSHALNNRQIQLFREIRVMFRGITASLANSSGIFLGASTHFDLVRPGYALYGGNPTPGNPNPMLPVVGLRARILQVRSLARGDTVGYGATWTAPREARIAIVAAGYGDGYLRSAGDPDPRSAAEVVIAETRCRIVGRISMDLLAVDVTGLPENVTRRGEWATLVGGSVDIDALAAQCGTIGYELLCGLGRRYARVWKR